MKLKMKDIFSLILPILVLFISIPTQAATQINGATIQDGTVDSSKLINPLTTRKRLATTLALDLTIDGIEETATAGENLVFGDVCYYKQADGKYWKSDADVPGTFPVVAMAAGTILADASGRFLLWGLARNDAWNWTTGSVNRVYLDTTAGGHTQTAPSAQDDAIQDLGFPPLADYLKFTPHSFYFTHTFYQPAIRNIIYN